jgi:aryl-alcohol dehydrogenase-like predicted oxidoreductase
MMFGQLTEEAESIEIIDRAIDAGINFFDTANVYGRGSSEEVVGKALKRNGKRTQIVLATKVRFPMADDDPNTSGNHRRHIIEQCEASLRRLQTDYIDLYQLHRPMSDIPIDETLRALDDLVRAGKVRYIGTSTFAAWQIMESLWVSKEYGLNRFVCEQPPYNLLDRRIERELVPMAQTYGLALIPWSPLAGGFLTGKYRRSEDRPEGSRFEIDRPNEFVDDHFTDRAFDMVELVNGIAKEKGCTISQFALAWCAQQPGITSPIIGPKTMRQFEDNLGALDVEITDEDQKRVDEIVPPGRAVVPYYQAGRLDIDFGPHLYRW